MTLKSNFKILVFILVSFTSCSGNNEQYDVTDKAATKISLSAGVGDFIGRAATDVLSTRFSVNNRIAIYINELTATSPSVIYANPIQYRVTNTSGAISPASGSEPFYPINGNMVEIYALYPYAAATSTGGIFTMRTKQVDKADYEACDLMAATIIGRDETNALSLSFKHLGSKITCHLTTTQTNIKLISSKVSLINAQRTAMLDPEHASIVSVMGDSSEPILISNDGSKDASGVILPQTIPANTRFIEIELLTKEKVYGIMPTTYTFQPGKSYLFNIDVQVDRVASTVTLGDIQIVDWVNEYSSPQDIEAERTN